MSKKEIKGKKFIVDEPLELDRGRPHLLDTSLFNNLVELVREGNWYSVTCSICGISYSAFNNWMKIGKKLQKEYEGRVDEIPIDKIKFLNFYEAIRKAEALVESDAVRKVLADKDWKAQITYLERKYPERWARTDRHKVEGVLQVNVAELTDQQLADIISGKDI